MKNPAHLVMMLQLPQLLLFLILATICTIANAWSLQATFLNAIKSSSLLTTLHQQHIASPTVSHMMKSTPLVDAPDEAKLEFATSFMGRLVANIMAKEQELLGDWKIDKIVEAAGNEFDEEKSHENLMRILLNGYDGGSNNVGSDSYGLSNDWSPKVTLFSFVDCPWCLLAKQLLLEEYQLENDTLQIIELENLGQEGKHLRASISLATGRTSMPACFINGKSVGGYTDGFFTDDDNDAMGEISEGFTFVPRPEVDLRMTESKGLESLHETGYLRRLLLER